VADYAHPDEVEVEVEVEYSSMQPHCCCSVATESVHVDQPHSLERCERGWNIASNTNGPWAATSKREKWEGIISRKDRHDQYRVVHAHKPSECGIAAMDRCIVASLRVCGCV